jgi:site-specific DNA-cytosine methylase
LKHASFFSGVGGLDLGFERSGIETVSVSEIDPYANAVLAERFPSAPNLGSITEVNANDIPEADIWSGGFPCQDLSVAGKRAGFAGKRSSLAFTFLDLVEQRRPRWLVLENVPGLFSSNGGADFGRLLYEMEQLRYGVSWRTLDARYFGVAQRRRRVFLVASLESDRAAEVLLECEGCERHPAPRWTQRQGVAGGAPDGSGIIGTVIAGLAHRTGTTQDQLYVGYGERVAPALTRRFSKGVNSTIDEPLIVSPSAHTDGVRAVDGLARRLDNQPTVDTFGAETHRSLQARDWKAGVANQDIGQEGFLIGYQTRVDEKHGNFSLNEADVANSLSALWPSDTSHRSMTLVQAVIQDSREMANKTQNGAGFSTEDISYTLTGVDRQAVATEPILSFPSRFGSNANVTEDQAQSMAHSAGAPAVLLDSQGDTREEQDLLPLGLDSHRYRCCGNGVVAPVAEWIGRRIVEVDRRWREEDK